MKKLGFTLVEMLIVLTVVAILVPTTFSIVFVILRQQVRIYRVIETRRQGDYMLNFIKDKLIRSSQITNLSPYNTQYCACASSDASCTNSPHSDPAGDAVAFLDTNDDRYRIFQNGTDLRYQVNGITTVLNTSDIEVTNFVISCARRAEYSAPLVGVSFDIEYIDNTPTVEEGSVLLHYQTKIKLRE